MSDARIVPMMVAAWLAISGSAIVMAEDISLAPAMASALERAQRLLEERQYKAAHDAALMVLSDNTAQPRDREQASLIRGAALVYLHRLRDAQDVLGGLAIMAHQPTVRTSAKFYLAESAYFEGDYQAATAEYQDVIAGRDRASEQFRSWAQEGMGWSYYHAGLCEQSFAAFEPLRHAARPLAAATLFALGDCARRLDRPGGAIEIFEQLVTDQPNDAWADEALLAWGDALVAQDEPEAARLIFERALRDYPTSALRPGFHVYVGQLAWRAQDVASAQEHFNIVVREHEHSAHAVSALVGLGDIAFERADLPTAAEHYRRAAAQAPRGPYAAYSLCHEAHAYFNQRQWERARLLYERVMDEFPASPWSIEAQYHAGQSSLALGETSRAIEQFAALVGAQPDSMWAASAHLAWADALLRLEQWDEAYQRYDDALAQYSDNPTVRERARIRQALCMAARGEQDAAMAQLTTALQQPLEPALAAEAHLALARLAVEAQDWATGREQLQQAAALDTDAETQAEIAFWEGWIAMQRGDWTAALRAWELLRTSYPRSAREAECRPWRLLAVAHVKGAEATRSVLEAYAREMTSEALTILGRTAGASLHDDGLAHEAIQVYTFLIDHAPAGTQAEWHFALGELYEELRRMAEAIAQYRRTMQPEASAPIAIRGALSAARLLEATDRLDEAVQLYRDVARSPNSGASLALERLQALQTQHGEAE